MDFVDEVDSVDGVDLCGPGEERCIGCVHSVHLVHSVHKVHRLAENRLASRLSLANREKDPQFVHPRPNMLFSRRVF